MCCVTAAVHLDLTKHLIASALLEPSGKRSYTDLQSKCRHAAADSCAQVELVGVRSVRLHVGGTRLLLLRPAEVRRSGPCQLDTTVAGVTHMLLSVSPMQRRPNAVLDIRGMA